MAMDLVALGATRSGHMLLGEKANKHMGECITKWVRERERLTSGGREPSG